MPRARPSSPAPRVRYLAEIAGRGRGTRDAATQAAEAAGRAHGLLPRARARSATPRCPAPLDRYGEADLAAGGRRRSRRLRQRYNAALDALGAEGVALLRRGRRGARPHQPTEFSYRVRDREVRGPNYRESLSHQQIPKIAAPHLRGLGRRCSTFLLKENLPGAYPYTGGVYPYRRTDEDPTRMFAGEGTPERTNRRFHYLARGQPATRLSTAFDSVTLYGEDPDERPDIYGKIGNSGVIDRHARRHEEAVLRLRPVRADRPRCR